MLSMTNENNKSVKVVKLTHVFERIKYSTVQYWIETRPKGKRMAEAAAAGPGNPNPIPEPEP